MKTCIRILIVSSAVAVASLTAGPSAAKSRHAPLLPAYVEECGSCHIAFPGRMLDAASWIAVLEGLEQHFGVDASVDAKTLEPIRAYLAGTARSKPTTAGGVPLLRITETRWFRHEHDEVPQRLWQEPDAVKPADCAACHRSAATGSYSEHDLRLPKKGEAK
ncbi:MAG: Diheme cytochrome c [Deltaproteobacteria bacterium]|nr:Diheme cytochrome c [Deltaproteobacteria bacterium]